MKNIDICNIFSYDIELAPPASLYISLLNDLHVLDLEYNPS